MYITSSDKYRIADRNSAESWSILRRRGQTKIFLLKSWHADGVVIYLVAAM